MSCNWWRWLLLMGFCLPGSRPARHCAMQLQDLALALAKNKKMLGPARKGWLERWFRNHQTISNIFNTDRVILLWSFCLCKPCSATTLSNHAKLKSLFIIHVLLIYNLLFDLLYLEKHDLEISHFEHSVLTIQLGFFWMIWTGFTSTLYTESRFNAWTGMPKTCLIWGSQKIMLQVTKCPNGFEAVNTSSNTTKCHRNLRPNCCTPTGICWSPGNFH